MLAFLFVLLAVAVRFLPHPFAFTPVTGALLFFGARSSRRHLWIPMVLLCASDVVLTKVVYSYAFTVEHYVSWIWYAAVLFLGMKLSKNARPLPVIGAALASSVSFFLVSNFSSWVSWTDMYPRTWSGLMMAYTAGIPFFRRAVEGDLFFTCAMFATPVLLHYLSEKMSRVGDHTSAA
jgi:hypothetical protein